jgi:hypothetical protein
VLKVWALRPSNATALQANHFVSAVKAVGGWDSNTMQLVLDLETTDGKTPAEVWAWVQVRASQAALSRSGHRKFAITSRHTPRLVGCCSPSRGVFLHTCTRGHGCIHRYRYMIGGVAVVAVLVASWVGCTSQAFLGQVQALTGKPGIIYTGYYFWTGQVGNPSNNLDCPLWIAAYDNNPRGTLRHHR